MSGFRRATPLLTLGTGPTQACPRLFKHFLLDKLSHPLYNLLS
jgi:hypothetical protein